MDEWHQVKQKNTVIPAKAGIQPHHQWLRPLDSGLRRNDEIREVYPQIILKSTVQY